MQATQHAGQVTEVLSDSYGRRFQYLRLSITDICNFKCSYCLPNGYQCHGAPKSNLNLAEIKNLLQVFSSLGTEKIRLTGGEPSVRKDLTKIIEIAASTPGINQVAMTTNGYKLKENIQSWADAGLKAINVSMDSLEAKSFELITGHHRLKSILEGVELALSLGLKVKANAVLLKGINDQQLPLFLNWVKHKNVAWRFIELMQTGDNHEYFSKHHLSGRTVVDWLSNDGWEACKRSKNPGPAIEYTHPDYLGKIGIIAPYSKDFCTNCNRLRVDTEGHLHLCLFASNGYSLRHLLQQESQQQELKTYLNTLLQGKEATHYLHQGYSGSTYNLSMLGG